MAPMTRSNTGKRQQLKQQQQEQEEQLATTCSSTSPAAKVNSSSFGIIQSFVESTSCEGNAAPGWTGTATADITYEEALKVVEEDEKRKVEETKLENREKNAAKKARMKERAAQQAAEAEEKEKEEQKGKRGKSGKKDQLKVRT